MDFQALMRRLGRAARMRHSGESRSPASCSSSLRWRFVFLSKAEHRFDNPLVPPAEEVKT